MSGDHFTHTDQQPLITYGGFNHEELKALRSLVKQEMTMTIQESEQELWSNIYLQLNSRIEKYEKEHPRNMETS